MTRVLIADDDIVVRDVVRRYLERDGLDVSIAHDGTAPKWSPKPNRATGRPCMPA